MTDSTDIVAELDRLLAVPPSDHPRDGVRNPWPRYRGTCTVCGDNMAEGPDRLGPHVTCYACLNHEAREAIAAARNHMRELLDRVEELEAENKDIRRQWRSKAEAKTKLREKLNREIARHDQELRACAESGRKRIAGLEAENERLRDSHDFLKIMFQRTHTDSLWQCLFTGGSTDLTYARVAEDLLKDKEADRG